MTMTALLDHRTIKRLSAEATVSRAARGPVEPRPAAKASLFVCQWHKDARGGLACSWHLTQA
jgi:hypothetical protein